ncbi:MAG: hypothetical protein SPH02_00390 [Campylobacter sp.]|uniref:hypothetical protein n=1 Tax=Campylobacter sp. TaxID=205 RepID=UPI002A95BD23|nr:hypothetical protein [Campylobacter sp.]MCI7075651.1 hypothetical protein [Campylobacter sp.]MDY5303370.1 hypothetical protein [Campylobacter sp.]
MNFGSAFIGGVSYAFIPTARTRNSITLQEVNNIIIKEAENERAKQNEKSTKRLIKKFGLTRVKRARVN